MHFLRTAPLSLIFFLSSYAWPCATGSPAGKSDAKAAQKYWAQHSAKTNRQRSSASITTNELPWAGNHSWGGPEKNWKPEAILANAVSEALNDGWNTVGAKDVLVSVPVVMTPGQIPTPCSSKPCESDWANRPYGDGQTNAVAGFGSWSEKQPQLVVTLVLLQSGNIKMKFRLHRTLNISSDTLEFQYNGKTKPLQIGKLVKNSYGDFEADWTPPANEAPLWGDLWKNRVAFVRPTGFKDWFPVDFRNVVLAQSELLSAVPTELQKFGKGTVLDPELVSVQGRTTEDYPFQKMGAENFAADIKGNKYFPVKPLGIHNQFHVNINEVLTTAVGEGSSVVFNTAKDPGNPGVAPFKMVYICFDQRHEDAEQLPGVPSGGGWHEIGDPAETVINSLENAPLVLGYANSVPEMQPPSGQFAFGLTDVTVTRKLLPGYGLVTAAGPTTLSEGKGAGRGTGGLAGRNYHWFFFDQTHYVCGMEWVSNCPPNPKNGLGLACPAP